LAVPALGQVTACWGAVGVRQPGLYWGEGDAQPGILVFSLGSSVYSPHPSSPLCTCSSPPGASYPLASDSLSPWDTGRE
jgi:hypothetical protein